MKKGPRNKNNFNLNRGILVPGALYRQGYIKPDVNVRKLMNSHSKYMAVMAEDRV